MLTPERRAELFQQVRDILVNHELDYAAVLLRQLQDAEAPRDHQEAER